MRLRRGRWPLSKGLLVEALLPLGVPTEVAHALAHTVEERLKRLRRKGGVTPRTLRRIFLEEVERELGPEKARLLAKQTLPFEEIFVVEGRKQRPFSKALLTRSLEDAGFSLREAHELAKAVERRLRLEGVRRIPAKRLEKVVAEEARRLYGPEAGERYRARLLYAGRYAALSPTPAFAHEERAEFQSLQVEAGFAGASLLYRLENPLGDRVDRVEAAYAAEGLGRLALAWVRGSYAEWRLAYAPPLPQRTCCKALWLAPELGLGPEGPSRYGLTLRYYDGCFAYEVRAARVLQGQHDEATGYTLSFGLTLR